MRRRPLRGLQLSLLLFDIDGTLVRGRPLTHQLALEEASAAVFGLRIEPGATPVADVEPWGKTDRQILRDVLERAGLPAPDPESLVRWERAASQAYERLEVEDAAEHEHAATAQALARLRDAGHVLALLTGNLVPIARARAGDVPREETVLIGDTPFDIAAASADGVRAIGITGHRFSTEALLEAGAAATVDEIGELDAALERLVRA